MAGSLETEDAIFGINVTPLVDITLVLLIIYMATAHLIAHRMLELSLPKVSHAQVTHSQTVQIILQANKTLWLNGVKVSQQELAVNVAQMAHLDPDLKVSVAADERVSWGDMAGILDILKGAGVTHVATAMEIKRTP